jgi:hypothetical protein
VKKNLVKTTNETTINVFLDTDLGNNIDDTLALVYFDNASKRQSDRDYYPLQEKVGQGQRQFK